MGNIDPTLLTVLVSTGVLAAISQLILAIAGFIRQKTNADVLSTKLDKNTDLTADIHRVTNGPLTEMEATMSNIETQVDKHAAEARATAEAAKIQAAANATSKEPP